MEARQFEELHLFNPHRTLGFKALQATAEHSHAVREFITTPTTSIRYDELTDTIFDSRVRVTNNIQEARTALTSFNGEKHGVLTTYLNALTPPLVRHSIQHTNMLREKPIGWKEWLSSYAIDDEILMLLFEHNTVMMEHATSEELADDILERQEKFLSLRDEFQEIGLIGRDLKDPSEVHISIGDIFDTSLKDMAGYYDVINDIVIGQGYKTNRNSYVDEVRSKLSYVLTHEFVHAFMGTALKDTKSPLSSRWINEAVTEMVSRSIRERFEAKPVDDDIYPDERTLLATLISPAKNPNNVKRGLMKAFSGTNEDRETFELAVDRMWNARYVIEKLSTAIKSEEKRLAKGEKVNTAMQTAAVKTVYEKFNEDPDAFLRRHIDEYAEELQAATHE